MASENADRYCICISAEQQDLNGKAAILNENRWPAGEEITVTFVDGDDSLKQRVREMAERWTAPGLVSNLTLRFVDSPDADIRIAFEQGDGSWSYLGTYCRQVPKDQPTMNYGWLTSDSDEAELQRVVLHEFGHALGLIHEHQNPQGGIDWNEPAVIADLSGPPNNWDDATIRSNVLDHYGKEDVVATDVDADSIMMYPIPAAWTNDGFSADLNDDLSDKDREFINKVYS